MAHLASFPLWLVLTTGLTIQSSDDEDKQSAPPQEQPPDEETPPGVAVLGSTGLEASSPDGRYVMHLWFRGQFRYAYPFDADPTAAEDFEAPAESSFSVRRARVKLGGNVYQPWLKYYFEYDFPSTRLLDLHFTLSHIPWLQLRVGQWKAPYNRERVDSSGRQQFVDRSIVNREFTLDRQVGVMVAGHLWSGSLADSWYMLGVFNGNGSGAANDDGSMMWIARYQWQFFGRELPFSQSDVEYHEQPAASLSFGTVSNRSPFTRFASSGGAQLDGFEEGEPGQYDLRQFVEEAAFKYRGLSFQHELHWKNVEDRVNETTTHLRGSYVQVGYFPWARSGSPLEPLEVAFRYAWVDPDTAVPRDSRTELTLAANWFFSGHNNKVTWDVSRLTLEQGEGPRLDDSRVRVQWDISF
jgi:phosphate-selective porin